MPHSRGGEPQHRNNGGVMFSYLRRFFAAPLGRLLIAWFVFAGLVAGGNPQPRALALVLLGCGVCWVVGLIVSVVAVAWAWGRDLVGSKKGVGYW